VVIRSSSAREAQQLVAELREADAVRRDAAIARLRVLGSRAVTRLSTLVRHDANAAARASALRALDGIDDPRVVEIAIGALRDADDDVRVSAVTALAGWVVREQGTRVMDALVTIALDRVQPSSVRLAALDALSQLPRDIVQPILEQTPVDASGPDGGDDPRDVQEWLAHHGDAPLSSLHGLIAHIREREGREPQAARRREWLIARGAVHAALARRGSRVALYDLREAFDGAQSPLPLDFLTAVTTIGDVTCLEPMARAWSTTPPGEAWWRDRLADAAADVASRLSLTGRSPAVKRVRAKWAGFLSTTLRTRLSR
jgi:hypothetical protein